MDGNAFPRLDAALLGLRRLTAAPSGPPVLPHDGTHVEVSTVLVVDAIARSPDGYASVGEVGRSLQVAASTASRLVDRAVRAGMVERLRAEQDLRRATLRLSADGARLQRHAVRFRTDRLRALLREWDQGDVELLTTLLERLLREVRRASDP